mmetsp:Transcript_8596/g.18492  ORF Transcript_8596/g.18492 Transcript_8596/m.18492 type:complete len:88 (+) Transcript_8596:2066-2329(+)
MSSQRAEDAANVRSLIMFKCNHAAGQRSPACVLTSQSRCAVEPYAKLSNVDTVANIVYCDPLTLRLQTQAKAFNNQHLKDQTKSPSH